jgi:hypothetical protein
MFGSQGPMRTECWLTYRACLRGAAEGRRDTIAAGAGIHANEPPSAGEKAFAA